MNRVLNFVGLFALVLYAVGWAAMFVVGPMFLVYQLLRLCAAQWGFK